MSTAAAIELEDVERVGALVRAPADHGCTRRGEVIYLSELAPVALVRFTCLCIALVPLRRLRIDLGAPIPPCEVEGCSYPRWKGTRCAIHPARAKSSAGSLSIARPAPTEVAIGESFEPTAQHASGEPPRPPADSGSTIDDVSDQVPGPLDVPEAKPAGSAITDESGEASPGPRRGALGAQSPSQASAVESGDAQAAGPRAPSPPAAGPGRTVGVTRPPSEPRATGTRAGRTGRGEPVSPLPGRGVVRIWHPEDILAALRFDAIVRGHTPSARDWRVETPSHPSAYRVARVHGSFPEAVKKAGLPPAPRGRRPRKAT